MIHDYWCYHAVTFQGYDWDQSTMWITDPDKDKGGLDLNQYDFSLGGTTGWIIEDYLDIPVDYYAILSNEVVPAPGALILGSIGVTFCGWFPRRRKEL